MAGREPLIGGTRPITTLVKEIAAKKNELLREQFSGIHNPWGAGAAFTDPWQFLEVCEEGEVIKAVRAVLGEDIVLWDSELFLEGLRYAEVAHLDAEGRYWPVDPLEGAIALVALEPEVRVLAAVAQDCIANVLETANLNDGPMLVIRYMAGASHFVRDPGHPAHRLCMEEQVLINYTNRPLWLVSGDNKGDSDLVTGFNPPVPTWAKAI